jgi:biotin carboxylase
VLEVNGRLGGGVPEMLFQASGVSLMRLSMRVALGEVVEVEGPVPCGKVGWRFLFQAPSFARRVVSIEGLDRVSALPEVNSVLVNRAPGDQLDVLDGTRQYVYSVFGASQDYEGLLEMNRFLHEEVAIAYE